MREIYRRLQDGTSLAESVASAQRELGADQELRLEVVVDPAARMLVTLNQRRRLWLVGPLVWRHNPRLLMGALVSSLPTGTSSGLSLREFGRASEREAVSTEVCVGSLECLPGRFPKEIGAT